MYTLCLLFSTLILGCYCNEKGPLVETPSGKVLGYHRTSHGGRKYSAFEGLPYAKPPIGSRRFEESEIIDPWIGVWNATYTTTCIQPEIFQSNVTIGTEDCLHINIYVPRVNPSPKDKMPIIVYIHGGGYTYGSGHDDNRPDLLMDRDVVFVTFNYRLGPFGFLSTEDDVVPGNNGLKDQTLALKWVQQNIASFGGNPESVTITGLSAGGSSVHLHYFSDLSRGLFHRGFSQSGLALNPWSIQEKPLKKTQKLAAAVGCPTSDTRKLVDCLKQRPSQQLSKKLEQFLVYLILPITPFGPVVEKWGSKPFLKDDPYVLLKKGQVRDVPWIVSSTIHEGALAPMFFVNDFDSIEEKWDEWAPHLLEYTDTAPESSWKSIAQKIKKQYFGDEKISQETYMNLVQVFTDRYFASGAEAAIRLQAKVTPVYSYLFGYPGQNLHKPVGHGNDGQYYYTNVHDPEPFTENELKMSKILIDMLEEYSKTGKPTVKGADWLPSKDDKLTYLKINGVKEEDITSETIEELGQKKFWDSLQFAEGENLIVKREEL